MVASSAGAHRRGSGRILNVDFDISCADEAKLRVAHECGTPASCMRTIRRASGELCRVWQHVRGLSFGEQATGKEMMYIMTVYVDVTEDRGVLGVAQNLAGIGRSRLGLGRTSVPPAPS